METNSKACLLKLWTQFPHQVLLRFMFSTVTLNFDEICLGESVSPTPYVFELALLRKIPLLPLSHAQSFNDLYRHFFLISNENVS